MCMHIYKHQTSGLGATAQEPPLCLLTESLTDQADWPAARKPRTVIINTPYMAFGF